MEGLRRRQMNPHLGAEIDCATLDLANQPLTKEGARSLFQSVMEFKVVALRNTGLGSMAFQELARQLQEASLEGTDVEKPNELLLETNETVPYSSKIHPEARGMVEIGPWPSKNGGAIGNATWHADAEFFQHPSWFTCLRMDRIPRDQSTQEVLPCGDTMWADMTVAYEDLPTEEKELYAGLRCVHDWKVAYPHVKRRAEQGRPGGWERVAELNELYPPIERPLVRKHPITGRMALCADPSYVSHIVGMGREETQELLQRAMCLCEVPEYQLRLPWHSQGDVIIHDNYAVMHRVVADFYDIPPESRLLQNIGTKGYPQPDNVLRPGAEVDDTHFLHQEERKQDRTIFSSTRFFGPGNRDDTKEGAEKINEQGSVSPKLNSRL